MILNGNDSLFCCLQGLKIEKGGMVPDRASGVFHRTKQCVSSLFLRCFFGVSSVLLRLMTEEMA